MKSSKFSWKLKLIVGKAFDNDNNNKNFSIEILIHSVNDQTTKLETFFDAFVNEIIKSFMKECN